MYCMRNRILTAASAGAVAAGLVLSACQSATKDQVQSDHESHEGQTTTLDTNVAQPVADHNDADVMFAQQMIAHHKQAIDLSELVADRTANTAIIDLARNIQAAQQPEINTFTQWLGEWGAPVDAQGHDAAGHMPGMVDGAVVDRMTSLSGTAFDKLWLQSMIAHHQGAIAMSNAELTGGKYPAAKELAQQIIDNQQPEIDTMQGLLEE